MIKAAFFDVDGTLFSHTKHETSDSTKRALRELQEKGILIFAATGRHYLELERFPVSDIAFDGYVLLNGQFCADKNKALLFGCPIDGEDVKSLLKIFEKEETPMTIIQKDRMFINFVNEAVVKTQEAVSSVPAMIGEYQGGEIYQVISYLTRDEEAAFAKNVPNSRITRWQEGGVDIISKTGGKAVGIEKMLELYGINRDEIIAFGDGENDMEMLEFAKIGVAMGNASDIVKAKADYLTDHIDEDGIEKALRHFGLIE